MYQSNQVTYADCAPALCNGSAGAQFFVLSCPNAEPCGLVAIHSIANGYHHVKIVHQQLAMPFVRRCSNFSNHIGQMGLTTFVDLVKMIVNSRHSNYLRISLQ